MEQAHTMGINHPYHILSGSWKEQCQSEKPTTLLHAPSHPYTHCLGSLTACSNGSSRTGQEMAPPNKHSCHEGCRSCLVLAFSPPQFQLLVPNDLPLDRCSSSPHLSTLMVILPSNPSTAAQAILQFRMQSLCEMARLQRLTRPEASLLTNGPGSDLLLATLVSQGRSAHTSSSFLFLPPWTMGCRLPAVFEAC